MRKFIPLLGLALLPVLALAASPAKDENYQEIMDVDSNIALISARLIKDLVAGDVTAAAHCLQIGDLKNPIKQSFMLAVQRYLRLPDETQKKYGHYLDKKLEDGAVDANALSLFSILASASEAYHRANWTLDGYCDARLTYNVNPEAAPSVMSGWVSKPVPTGDAQALKDQIREIDAAIQRKIIAELLRTTELRKNAQKAEK